jgi:hypothetical protein
MSTVYQPRELGPARTLIAVAALILVSLVLWFPKGSLLHSAGVLVSMLILVGIRNPASTMATAWISVLTAATCIAAGLLFNYQSTMSRLLSFVGIGLAISLGIFHLSCYLKRRKHQRNGQARA